MNVQKKAQELANAILTSGEYQKLTSARERVDRHQAAKVMLRDFQQKQVELHKQQMEGEEVTKEQEEQLQALFGVISINPYIRELFEAEFAFSGLMLEVNEILSEALDFGEEGEEAESKGEQEPKLSIPKKRILIPGQDI